MKKSLCFGFVLCFSFLLISCSSNNNGVISKDLINTVEKNKQILEGNASPTDEQGSISSKVLDDVKKNKEILQGYNQTTPTITSSQSPSQNEEDQSIGIANYNNFNQIQTGMSEADVIAIMGNPTTPIQNGSDYTVLEWYAVPPSPNNITFYAVLISNSTNTVYIKSSSPTPATSETNQATSAGNDEMLKFINGIWYVQYLEFESFSFNASDMTAQVPDQNGNKILYYIKSNSNGIYITANINANDNMIKVDKINDNTLELRGGNIDITLLRQRTTG